MGAIGLTSASKPLLDKRDVAAEDGGATVDADSGGGALEEEAVVGAGGDGGTLSGGGEMDLTAAAKMGGDGGGGGETVGWLRFLTLTGLVGRIMLISAHHPFTCFLPFYLMLVFIKLANLTFGPHRFRKFS